MMAAHSCVCDGFSSLISNLVSSFDYEIPSEGASHWLQVHAWEAWGVLWGCRHLT